MSLFCKGWSISHSTRWKYALRRFSKDVYIGKPDKHSNIRPILIKYKPDDTKLESRLKDIQGKTQQWHHEFWDQHNRNYLKSRENFIKQHQLLKNAGDKPDVIEPEEMAVFHRQFLKENYTLHQTYDRTWKKLNRQIIYLMALTTIQRLFLFIFKPFRTKTKKLA